MPQRSHALEGFAAPALLLLCACSQSLYPEFSGRSEIFEMDSQQVGDSFEIQVHLPVGYDESGGPVPVVYTLDGSVHSEPAAGMAESLGLQIVVVGIGYDDGYSPVRRRRDYSPTTDDNYEKSGGTDEFFAFVTDDIIPRIESDYQTDPARRTLMGHSQGGLAATYFALKQDPEDPVFSSVAAASPALWWDRGVMLEIEEDFASFHPRWPLRFFASISQIEPIPLWGYYQEFFDRVEARGYTDLQLRRANYDRTTHDTAWIEAYEDALEHFYGG